MVSFQLIRKHKDPKDMWKYIKKEISTFYTIKERNQDISSLMVLPEYALGNKIRFPTSKINYEEILDECKDLTTKFNFNLFAGSAAVNEEEKWKNRCFFINSEGEIQFYDKQKLFNYEKKLNFSAGEKSKIFELPHGIRCQTLICSDLWYPELIRDYITDLPDIVVVPAMSVVPQKDLIGYGRWLWHSLATTRSRENVLPVVVADWAVQSFGESWTCGASSILNPSIKWTSKPEYEQAFVTFNEKKQNFISTIVSLSDIYEYRKYRRETGLLPE
ncbi:MAG: carbon-nitrogen hydrolase family protein [Candidatus Hodarchaeales archaeon]